MRQCLTRAANPRRIEWPLRLARWTRAPPFRRDFRTTNQGQLDDRVSGSAIDVSRKYRVFKRIRAPESDKRRSPAAWTSLLEPGLPPHLRQNAETQKGESLDATDIAEIILAAQSQRHGSTQIDVLCHLGIGQGRWRAVVWLVKRLVDAFAPEYLRPTRLSKTLHSWSNTASLDQITAGVIDVQNMSAGLTEGTSSNTDLASLHDLTDNLKPERLSRKAIRWHDGLGIVWRSIGFMTINSAGGEIQPEVLEIIAYLHHMQIMSTSIYNQKPSSDPTAVQQPLMLSLFSSRILTSLSDAAWRAHANSVVEEAKSKGTAYGTLRPEIPGMAYRVHVAGLRPEVWLELILWSCLHGGWILQGTSILHALYDVPENVHQRPKLLKWRPLSWRLLADYAEHEQDWDRFEYLFNTDKLSSARDSYTSPESSIQRTISTEVVNAYVDALLSTVRQGVGERGVASGTVLIHLQMLHQLLARSHSKLATGSWDAVVLRFVDTIGSIDNSRSNFDRLISLSPVMGEELQVNDNRKLPAYVFDGSAAVLGLFHQALRSKVKAGDIHGALALFQSLQTLADKNKHQSVVDFLRKQNAIADEDEEGATDMFASKFSGIEYPAFQVSVPITILGPFLELVADAKAYDFGRWLLYSDEIDGPVLSEEHYGNADVAPALIRFATETQDTALLSKVLNARSSQSQPGEPTRPRNILQSFFDSQVNLRRWESAIRVLEQIKNTEYFYWNIVNLAHVVRVMLSSMRGSEAADGNAVQDLAQAKSLLQDMVQGKYERTGERWSILQDHLTLLLTILATLDRSWADFATNLQPLDGVYRCDLPVKAFNLVLEGIVEAYGSLAGRRLVDTLGPRLTSSVQRTGQGEISEESGEPTMSRYRPSVLDDPEMRKTVITVQAVPQETVTLYGGLKTDLMTIYIVFSKAAEELQAQITEDIADAGSQHESAQILPTDRPTSEHDSPALATVFWAIRRFRSLRMANEDIKDELRKRLSNDQMEEIKRAFPTLFDQAAASNDVEDAPFIGYAPATTE